MISDSFHWFPIEYAKIDHVIGQLTQETILSSWLPKSLFLIKFCPGLFSVGIQNFYILLSDTLNLLDKWSVYFPFCKNITELKGGLISIENPEEWEFSTIITSKHVRCISYEKAIFFQRFIPVEKFIVSSVISRFYTIW